MKDKGFMKDKIYMIFIHITIILLFVSALLAIWGDGILASKIALTGLSIFGLGYAIFLCWMK